MEVTTFQLEAPICVVTSKSLLGGPRDVATVLGFCKKLQKVVLNFFISFYFFK